MVRITFHNRTNTYLIFLQYPFIQTSALLKSLIVLTFLMAAFEETVASLAVCENIFPLFSLAKWLPDLTMWRSVSLAKLSFVISFMSLSITILVLNSSSWESSPRISSILLSLRWKRLTTSLKNVYVRAKVKSKMTKTPINCIPKKLPVPFVKSPFSLWTRPSAITPQIPQKRWVCVDCSGSSIWNLSRT